MPDAERAQIASLDDDGEGLRRAMDYMTPDEMDELSAWLQSMSRQAGRLLARRKRRQLVAQRRLARCQTAAAKASGMKLVTRHASSCRRASHRNQAGHRRTASSRAGPDPDSDEPEPPSGDFTDAPLGVVA